MGWKEEVKKIFDLPEDAQIITKPYYREIPKKNGKRYRALTIQYVQKGRKRYKHVSKEKEILLKSLMTGEDAVVEYVFDRLKELKEFLENLPNEKAKRNLYPLRKEIDRLLAKLSMRIF